MDRFCWLVEMKQNYFCISTIFCQDLQTLVDQLDFLRRNQQMCRDRNPRNCQSYNGPAQAARQGLDLRNATADVSTFVAFEVVEVSLTSLQVDLEEWNVSKMQCQVNDDREKRPGDKGYADLSLNLVDPSH